MRFNGWSAAELDFFFAIIAKARNKGTNLLEFSKDELKALAESSEKNNDRLKKTFTDLEMHIMGLRYTETVDDGPMHIRDTRVLFDRFRIEWNDETQDMKASVKLSSESEYILNQLTANFTSFELEEFLSFRSVYSKQLYRHLKQWRTVGKKEFKLDEFREILNIPASYEQRDIKKRVLAPILKELPKAFENFTVEPIKADRRGQPVIGYSFKWRPEKTGEWQDDKPYTIDYNLKKERRRKRKKKPELPDWYSITEGTEPEPELLEMALQLQRGEAIKINDKVEAEQEEKIEKSE